MCIVKKTKNKWREVLDTLAKGLSVSNINRGISVQNI